MKSLIAFLPIALYCASIARAQTLEWTRQLGTKGDGDYDNDGDVDGDDFLGWQTEFGSGSGAASAAVPEPASVVLLLVLATGAMLSRRGGTCRVRR